MDKPGKAANCSSVNSANGVICGRRTCFSSADVFHGPVCRNFEFMDVLRKIRFPHPGRLLWRRIAPASWLLAAASLGLFGWAHFSDSKADKTPESAYQSAVLVATSDSLVTRLQHETDEGRHGFVVNASATDQNFDLDAGHSEGHSPDERFRKAILGKWEDEYRGKRHLTVTDDGAGTMVVEPDGLGRRLFADLLTFDLEWNLVDGRVTMKMLGGEPKSKVNLILKLHGREAEYKILNLDDEQLLLLDPDGKTRYDWRRPAPSVK